MRILLSTGKCLDPWLNAILPRVQALPPIASKPRHSRDIRLGAAAAILAGSVAVLAAADLLYFVDLLEGNLPLGFRIASGCRVIFDLILIPVFALGSVAFLSRPERRARRLGFGAILAASGAIVGLIGAGLAAGVTIAHHYPSTSSAGLCFEAAGSFCTVLAALAAFSGFSKAAGTAANALGRDSRLVWAAVGLAGAYGFVTISQVFFLRYYSEHGASASLTTGIDIAIAGSALAIGAGAIGAVGFHGSDRRQRQGIADWVSPRDGVLGVAMTAFAMASLLMGLGTFWQTSTGGQNGFDSTQIALGWLSGASLIGNAVASVCASDGFARSRR
ncbi:MAG: hypothetical protein WB507_05155 [Solirubrobacterales bacterium]